jgi:hypothetical protein
VSAKCSNCQFCGNPSLLKKYEQGKRGRGYRQVKCRFPFVDPVLQCSISYDTTCWNARKHDGFCGVRGKKFKRV